MDTERLPGIEEHDLEEVTLIARGIATAVAPEDGLAEVQADLLQAIATALTGHTIDYRSLDPLGKEELAKILEPRDLGYRQRIVHHMVLGEMVLRPLPTVVAHRVAQYATALGVEDHFVRVARRYAQGAYALAWMDLQRSGFSRHVQQAADALPGDSDRPRHDGADPFAPAELDIEIAERWMAYEDLPAGTLGRCVWEMYDTRGFALPGTPGGAPEYLSRHDYVHVLADYGTNLKGELEVFGFIGRANPDPQGFAWLAMLVGLFETGYIGTSGFFDRDTREHNLRAPGMNARIADSIRRGKVVCEHHQMDLFDFEYHEHAHRPVPEIREMLHIPEKWSAAVAGGSAGLFELEGMSEVQRQRFLELRGDGA